MNDKAAAWIALVRHGVTDWNARGIIQGRTDIPLSAAGRAKLRRTRGAIAGDFLRARWFASSLTRARQTAAILNPGAAVAVHDALMEADWGDFEGLRRDELAGRIRDLRLTPRRGLDFRPPGGESPREVRRRLARWFAEVAESPAPAVAVTHKGVLRSALSLACDWDMRADFDATFGVEVKWDAPHVFGVGGDGRVRLLRLNCPWDAPPGDGDGDGDGDDGGDGNSNSDGSDYDAGDSASINPSAA